MLALAAFLVLFGSAFNLLNALQVALPSSSVDELEGKLVFAHIIYRHGDRTPVDPYPNDPWGDPKYWPTGWGQLTNTGKRQHYELGKWLRRRYNSLLNTTYSLQDVYVQSTDVDRTLMSAYSNLAGMFPPQGKDVWNEELNWQPIPVHTTPEILDVVLANKKPCPAYDYAFQKLMQTDYFQTLNKRFTPLYEFLTKMTGRTINTLELAEKIHDTFYIEQLYNLTLPTWAKQIYPSEELSFVSRMAFAADTYTPLLARLKAGPLLQDILNRFQNKANNNLVPNRSLWIYSAHDTTVANFLSILRIFEPHTPPYRSCIMLEMRMIENVPFISVFYKNSSAEPQLMNLPNCGKQCALKKMFQLYNDVLPEDWNSECEVSMLTMTYEEANSTPGMAILVFGSLFALAMLLLCSAIIYYRRKQHSDYQWYMQING